MKVSFLGSGAWASALANVVSDNGHDVLLYGVCKEEIDDINLSDFFEEKEKEEEKKEEEPKEIQCPHCKMWFTEE